MPQEFYQEEDAEAILRIASQNVSLDGVSRERLLANAAELGISAEAVEEAEQTYLRQKQTMGLRAKFKRHQRQEYWSHLVTYLVVNGFLFLINMVTDRSELWVVFPILGWGIGMVIHTWYTFFGGEEAREQEFERWARRRRNRVEEPMSTDELRQMSRQERHQHLHFGISVGDSRPRD